MLRKWRDLFTKVIIDENEEVACLAVVEKVIEEKSELKPAFRNIVSCFCDIGIVSKESVNRWKGNKVSQFKTLMDGVVKVSEDLHEELIGVV